MSFSLMFTLTLLLMLSLLSLSSSRNYRTARPSTLNLRGRCPGAGAARITQPLGDKVPFAPPVLFNYD